jgi:hypothetical protein
MVDTVLSALGKITSEQAQATKRNPEKAIQLLDYLATHSIANV